MAEVPKSRRELTCITGPMGCALTVELADGVFVSVSGNRCKRGEAYAYAEVTHPARTLTTTMAAQGAPGILVPVNSDRPLPKECLLEAMRQINRQRVKLPVKRGDVVMTGLFGGNMIATRSVDEPAGS